jgi:hypothetical protein
MNRINWRHVQLIVVGMLIFFGVWHIDAGREYRGAFDLTLALLNLLVPIQEDV